MLILSDGAIRGSIGGGAVEYQAVQTGLEAMKEKKSLIRGFSLTRNQIADIGMVCGGDVDVYFQYVSPDNSSAKEICHKILEAFVHDKDSWLVMDITDEICWQMGLYTRERGLEGIELPKERGNHKEGFSQKEEWKKASREFFQKKAVRREAFGRKYYIEPLVCAGTVYVFGGGHVAQELVPLLSHLHFRCVVMDDQEAFARAELFPQAKKIIVGDLKRISDYIHIRPWDYVCIMTRGHQYDYYVQKQAMNCHPRYIGVMGSRNKVAVVTEKLLQDGFTKEEIQSCHMPIGMAVFAETPAEIAVSIAGELIKIRAEG